MPLRRFRGLVGSQNPIGSFFCFPDVQVISKARFGAVSERGDLLDRLCDTRGSVRRNSRLSFDNSVRAIPLRGLAPGVSMMKTSEPGAWDGHRRRRRPVLDRALVWRVFPERIMNPILVVIRDLFSQEPA